MKNPNGSTVNEIILSGFSNLESFRSLLFIILLVIYLFIIFGNAMIIFVVHMEPSLHMPMYFFIITLCFMEICYTTVTIPKMLANLLDDEKKMSLNGCLLQVYFLHTLGAAEYYLLTIMAYDRYLAIYKPLQYPSIMTTRLCIQLVFGCIIIGIMSPITQTVLVSFLPFCGLNLIHNGFCDFPLLISLACTDTALYTLVEFSGSSFIILFNCMCVLLSYIRIIHVVLKIKSKQGWQKAFSTCGAHHVVVVLYFGSIGFMYLRVTKTHLENYDRSVSLTYAVFTPLANPVIYRLRNKEIKKSIHKHLHPVKYKSL
ncbi:olfactory receptor 6N2-like [Discoglossus pictus]